MDDVTETGFFDGNRFEQHTHTFHSAVCRLCLYDACVLCTCAVLCVPVAAHFH